MDCGATEETEMERCEGCGEATAATYDGGFCEDCAIDNLPVACDRTVVEDRS